MTNYIYEDQLATKRLTTRFLTSEYILPWSDFFRDKEAIEFMPAFDQATEEEKSGFWISRQLTRYAEKRFGLQALIDKTTNQFIGQCGLLLQEVDGAAETEVGYHIFKKYWGRGYAPEAAKLFMDFAFQNNLTDSIISIIDTKNFKSQRVAEKNGLQREKQTKWREFDVFIYRIHKKEWE
jgi:RimJ/RimL family protein N-acetyltransferase